MAVTGTQILTSAADLLFDKSYTRWTLPELVRWLNEAMRSIVLVKPSAKSGTMTISLALGTKQSVIAATGLAEPVQIIDIIRNMPETATSRLQSRTIKVVSRDLLDSENPHWHDSRETRFRREVRNACFDEQNPLEFFVYPGNDGTGKVEALVSQIPAELVATGDVDDLASYATEIDLPDIYSTPILDYVAYRAFSKDDAGNPAGRATSHYQQYAAAIGLKIKVEGASSPNSRRVAS